MRETAGTSRGRSARLRQVRPSARCFVHWFGSRLDQQDHRVDAPQRPGRRRAGSAAMATLSCADRNRRRTPARRPCLRSPSSRACPTTSGCDGRSRSWESADASSTRVWRRAGRSTDGFGCFSSASWAGFRASARTSRSARRDRAAAPDHRPRREDRADEHHRWSRAPRRSGQMRGLGEDSRRSGSASSDGGHQNLAVVDRQADRRAGMLVALVPQRVAALDDGDAREVVAAAAATRVAHSSVRRPRDCRRPGARAQACTDVDDEHSTPSATITRADGRRAG